MFVPRMDERRVHFRLGNARALPRETVRAATPVSPGCRDPPAQLPAAVGSASLAVGRAGPSWAELGRAAGRVRHIPTIPGGPARLPAARPPSHVGAT